MDKPDPIVVRREDLKIEGDRNLYLYTFEAEPEAEESVQKPKGNLTSDGAQPE